MKLRRTLEIERILKAKGNSAKTGFESI